MTELEHAAASLPPDEAAALLAAHEFAKAWPATSALLPGADPYYCGLLVCLAIVRAAAEVTK